MTNMKTNASITHNSFISKSLRIALAGILLSSSSQISFHSPSILSKKELLAPASQTHKLTLEDRQNFRLIQNEIFAVLKEKLSGGALEENLANLKQLFHSIPEFERLQLQHQFISFDRLNPDSLLKIFKHSNLIKTPHRYSDKLLIKEIVENIKQELYWLIRPLLLEQARINSSHYRDMSKPIATISKSKMSKCFRIPGHGKSYLYKCATGREHIMRNIQNLIQERDALKKIADSAEGGSPYFISIIQGPLLVNFYGFHYIALVMDYAEGFVNLETFIDQNDPLSANQIKELIVKLLHAVDQIEEAGLVYLDFKPENILISQQGGELSVKLIDFGLAHPVGESPFKPDVILGSPPYFSPEELRGEVPYTNQQDLFRLGLVFYTLLSGGEYPYWEPEALPTEPKELISYLNKAYKKRKLKLLPEPDDPEQAALIKMVYWMLEKDPASRPQNAKDLLRDLEPITSSVLGTAKKSAGTIGTKQRVIKRYLRKLGRGTNIEKIYNGKDFLDRLDRRLISIGSNRLNVLELVRRLKDVSLNKENKQHKKYIDARWNQIDWDQFGSLLTMYIIEASRRVKDKETVLRIHDLGNDLGFYPDESKRDHEPPIWALASTDPDGTRVVHLTQQFYDRYALSPHMEDQYFALQVLFHEIFEDDLGRMLKLYDRNVKRWNITFFKREIKTDTLKHPIMVALELLSEEGLPRQPSGSFQTLPNVSLSQKRTLQYAARRRMRPYLDSLEAEHPFDFEGSFAALRDHYSNLLDRLDPLLEDKNKIRNLFDLYLESLDERKRFQLIHELLRGEQIASEFLESLYTYFGFQEQATLSGYKKEKVIFLLSPLLASLLEEKAISFNKDQVESIYKGPLSQCFRFKDGNKDRFIKVPLPSNDIQYLINEKEVLTHLNTEAENSPFFVSFVEGPKIIRINGEVHVALLMEHIPNSSNLTAFLRKRTDEGNPLKTEEVLSLMKQLLEALTELEAAKVIVRDIKPDNILVQEDPVTEKLTIKLIDFGFGYETDEEFSSPFPPDKMFGTPFYFSPEEIDYSYYSFQQDLWKMGVTFYNILTNGNMPFWEIDNTPSSKDEAYDAIRYKDLIELEPTDFRDPLLKGLTSIINHMLRSKNSSERYFNAEEVLENLRFLEDINQDGFLGTLIQSGMLDKEIKPSALKTILFNNLVPPRLFEEAI